MGDESHEYLFDFDLRGALRIRAGSEAEARKKLTALLDCAETNFGSIDGEPMVGETSLAGDLSLAMVDSEAV